MAPFDACFPSTDTRMVGDGMKPRSFTSRRRCRGAGHFSYGALVWLVALVLMQLPPEGEARARQQFVEAQARFEQGDARGAERLFLESYAVLPLAPTAWNIARCVEAQGADATAIGWYRRYLKLRPAATDRADVEASIAALEQRLATRGRQALTVFLSPPTATAQIDEQPVALRDGDSVELAPASHRVVVTADGYVSSQLELRLSDRASQEVTVTLVRRETEKHPPMVVVGLPPDPAPVPLPRPTLVPPVVAPRGAAAVPAPPAALKTKAVEPTRPHFGLGAGLGLGVGAVRRGLVRRQREG
jgi:hypothetical protein